MTDDNLLMMRYRLLWFIPVLFLSACSPEPVHETRFMMGTLVEFTIEGVPRATAMKAIAAAAGEMARIERKMSIYGPKDNPIKRFNRTPERTDFIFDDEIDKLLAMAVAIEAASGHAFHPALGSLNRLWGFSLDPPPSAPPKRDAIRRLLPAGGCLKRTGDHRWQRMTRSCQIDLGGIAKGYAIERGMAQLIQHGVRHALINAGGDIASIGDNMGKPWRIGIRHPRKPGGLLGWIHLKHNECIVTSGDYERFFMYHGKRYHHILDPRTGYPATRAIGTTVIAKEAALADAWSTALFVMGARGLEPLQQQGMAALVVRSDGTIIMNEAMQKRFHSIETR